MFLSGWLQRTVILVGKATAVAFGVLLAVDWCWLIASTMFGA